MKKLLPTIGLLLLLIAGGGALYLFQRQGRNAGSAGAIAEFLPADTQLLLSIPDLNGTLADWKSTDLYKIWAEPEMQAFLARPISKLPPHPEFDRFMEKVAQLSPTQLFVAVTAGEDDAKQPSALAGFSFKGDKAAIEELVAGAKDALRRKYPAGKADLIEYQGHPVEIFDGGDGNTVASTYLENRYLVSNDLGLLKGTVDRCDNRPPAPGTPGSLDKEEDFQAVLSKLPTRYATLAFARPRASLRRLFDLTTASGQPVDSTRRAELERVKAVGATTKIEHGKLRDTLYYLAPGMNQAAAKLDMNSLPLTSQNTVVYASAILDLPSKFDLSGGPMPPGTPVSGLLTSFQELAAMLQAQGVTLERFRSAFGHEFALHIDWPPDQAQPALILSVDIRDQAQASHFVETLTHSASAVTAWQTTQANGLTFHTMSGGRGGGFVNPTFTLTGKHLILGLNPPEVREAAQREQAAAANFTGGEAYQKTLAIVTAPNASFAYIDGPVFFERLYGTLRGFAMFSALFYPHLDTYVDITKLPATKTISKHLSPTVFTQSTDEQGSLLESVGSVTVGQAGFVLLSGAGAAAFPLIQNQLGASTLGAGTFPTLAPTPVPPPVIMPPPPSPQPGGNE